MIVFSSACIEKREPEPTTTLREGVAYEITNTAVGVQVKINSKILPRKYRSWEILDRYGKLKYGRNTSIRVQNISCGFLLTSNTCCSGNHNHYSYLLFMRNPPGEARDYIPGPLAAEKALNDSWRLQYKEIYGHYPNQSLSNFESTVKEQRKKEFEKFTYESTFSHLLSAGPSKISGEVIQWTEGGETRILSYGTEFAYAGGPSLINPTFKPYRTFMDPEKTRNCG